MATKRTIFICYSHADTRWIERIRTALKPLTGRHRLDPWDDQRIKPGADWRKEIQSALAASNAAVLLVTPSFLASDFIVRKELPVILRRHKREGLPVVWIHVSASSFKQTALEGMQAAHDPSRPLDTLPVPKRNKVFVEIATRISEAAATNALGHVLRITDAVTPAILSEATGRDRRRKPGIVSRQHDGRVEFHDRGGVVVDVIDPPDLGRLSEAERQLIATYQASMAAAFTRWQSLYPRRAMLTRSEQASLRRARRQMCDDLGKVIDFMSGVGKDLQDHYGNVRFECEQLQRSRR